MIFQIYWTIIKKCSLQINFLRFSVWGLEFRFMIRFWILFEVKFWVYGLKFNIRFGIKFRGLVFRIYTSKNIIYKNIFYIKTQIIIFILFRVCLRLINKIYSNKTQLKHRIPYVFPLKIQNTQNQYMKHKNSLQNTTDKLGDEIWWCYPCCYSEVCIEPMTTRLFCRTVFKVQPFHLYTFTPLLCYTQQYNHKLVLWGCRIKLLTSWNSSIEMDCYAEKDFADSCNLSAIHLCRVMQGAIQWLICKAIPNQLTHCKK